MTFMSILFIWYFMEVFSYVFITLLIVYMLNTAIKGLFRYSIKKNRALAIVLLSFLLIILSSIYFITPSIKEEISSVSSTWPEIMQRVNQQVFSPVIEDGEITGYFIPVLGMQFESGDIRTRLNALLDQLKSLI